MITIKGKIDDNDLSYVLEKRHKIVACAPAPTINGRPHFNVSQFLTSTGKTVSVFHIKPIYYEAKNGTMRPLSEVTIYHGNRNIVLNDRWSDIHPRYLAWLAKRQRLFGKELNIPSRFDLWAHQTIHDLATGHIGLTVTTVYPDAHTETTTVDGYVVTNMTPGAWSSLRSNAGDGHSDDGVTMAAPTWRSSNTTTFGQLGRGFALFDTSSITDTDTIDSAILSIYGDSRYDPRSNAPKFTIVASTPASNTDLVNSDFANVGTTNFGDKTYASWSDSGYNDITLNASGLAAISKTGVSKFGILSDYDLNNTAPTGSPGVPDEFNGYIVKTADQSGTTYDPKLAVTHSVAASGPANLKTWNGVAKASLKTWNGVAIASLKSWNGIV